MVLVSGGGDGGDGEAEIHLYGVIEREEISIPLATATNSPNLCRLALRLSLKEALLARSAYLEAAVKLPAFGNLVSAPLENVKTSFDLREQTSVVPLLSTFVPSVGINLYSYDEANCPNRQGCQRHD